MKLIFAVIGDVEAKNAFLRQLAVESKSKDFLNHSETVSLDLLKVKIKDDTVNLWNIATPYATPYGISNPYFKTSNTYLKTANVIINVTSDGITVESKDAESVPYAASVSPLAVVTETVNKINGVEAVEEKSEVVNAAKKQSQDSGIIASLQKRWALFQEERKKAAIAAQQVSSNKFSINN